MPLSHIFKKQLFGDISALFSGILLTLAFAPFEIFPIAIISPAILLATWLNSSKNRAFLRGWLFGVGLFSSGIYWIFISVHTFGNTSIPLALLITGGLMAILALFPAFNGYLLVRFFPINNFSKIVCAFPAIWVMLEWVRSWVFSGFPWLFLGYSQLNSPLKGYAPIFSVYGVSLCAAITAAVFVNIFLCLQNRKYQQLYFSALIIFSIWILGSVLHLVNWTKSTGNPIKISLVQGNIPQELKWSPDQILPTFHRYMTLTEKNWDSKIIIWPESAIPAILQNAETIIEEIAQKASQHQTTIITGIPVESPQSLSYYNAVIALGEGSGIYTKQRLVPFGEYVPFKSLSKKFFDIFQIPMSDFISGPGSLEPIQIDHLKIATFICYEIAFPEQVRSRDGNIGMILTVSNDAWFGHSIAQAQHLEIGRMRALEMGRPVLFSSNNGITAFIDSRGDIQSIAPPFESFVLTDSIKAYIGKTPWQIIGMDPILIIMVSLLGMAIYQKKKIKGIDNVT